jgi:signal transduction histidine kinase
MSTIEEQDIYAALLHEMKNTLVLMSITLDQVPHTQEKAHDDPLDETRLLCQRTSERLMQAMMIYKSGQGSPLLNAIDGYSTEDFIEEMAIQTRSLRADLDVTTTIAEDVPAIWFFDRNMLELALINALHNSITYTRGKVRISARIEDQMLCISIQDDSEGYPQHILDSVSQDKPLSSNGTGLGLRFSSMIAKAHTNQGRAGFLRLRNDHGAVFEICVP